jgi:predicted RNA-binding Zn-ribbon protein involved in translation (DUF1610 family)
MMTIKELDDAGLNLELAQVLATWPLYRELTYKGSSSIVLPDLIEFYCTQCTKKQLWRSTAGRSASPQDFGRQLKTFRCANCKDQAITFAYVWRDVSKGVGADMVRYRSFTKFGQWPAQEERIPPELEAALGQGADLDLYRAALRLRNFNNGIGAMAYMRRVVNNHIDEMLEILSEDTGEGNGHSSERLERLKRARFAEKLEAAANLFPTSLVPVGSPNPLEPLYELSGEALYGLSDSESVDLFDQCRLVFEYVFSRLRPQIRERRKFQMDLQRLASRQRVLQE